MSDDCIFCKIIAGDIPSFKLYEDEDTYAFMDINPVHDGHSLAIPKEHAADVHSVSPDALSATFRTAQKVAGAVNEVITPDGLNIVQCNGKAAAQSVLHFHVHVVPRKIDDKLPLNWGLKPGDMAVIGKFSEQIRSRLNQ